MHMSRERRSEADGKRPGATPRASRRKGREEHQEETEGKRAPGNNGNWKGVGEKAT